MLQIKTRDLDNIKNLPKDTWQMVEADNQAYSSFLAYFCKPPKVNQEEISNWETSLFWGGIG